jgi:superfamily II DNA or RNA helicase
VGLLDNDMTRAEEIVRDLQRTIGILVIDEAHRAAAPSYGRILADLLPKERLVSIIGLTATPFREEYLANDPDKGTKELKSIFENLIEPVKTLGENPRMELVNRGVLARPVFESIPTPTSMKVLPLLVSPEISDADIARIDWAMALRADNSARRLAILNKLLPLTKNCSNSILYFGPSVRDAECMAFLLRQENVLAAVLSGETREVTRRRLIEKFRGGTLRVLCNCEVLTTGFDAPRVTHIVMARPKVSRVLYEQIIGRGLRGPLFGGTETCVILDCEDNFRDERPPLGYESFRSIWDKQSCL